MTKTILILTACISVLFAAPANYEVLRTLSSPVVDGNLSDWPEVFFIDSLTSDNNVICRDALTPWAREDIQFCVYSCYDSDKVYFAIKMVSDDTYLPENTWCSDAFKINPGGQAMAFYVRCSGDILINPSCPYDLNSTLFAVCNPTGNNGLAAAEISLAMNVVDPLNMMYQFQLYVGMDENDSVNCHDEKFLGIGVEYTGQKQDWASSGWDNPLYYPTFHFSESVKKEVNPLMNMRSEIDLQASPNPFVSTVTLEIPKNLSSQKAEIFSLDGRKVAEMNTKGKTRVDWDASRYSAGVYVVKVAGKNGSLQRRITLIK